MAYCLVKVSGKFVVVDEELIDGPTLVGEPVKVIAGDSREDGIMFAKGRKSEMEKERRAFEGGKEPVAKRERKKRTTQFDSGSPPPPLLKVPKTERTAKAVAQKQPVVVEENGDELEDLSDDDAVAVDDAPAPPLPNHANVLDVLQQLVRGQDHILRELGEIKNRISSLERNARTTAEAAACTRTELLARKDAMNKVEAGWDSIDSTLKAVAESLPPPPKVLYTFMAEDEVDALDLKKDDLNAFAIKVDNALFDNDELTKNLKERDARKVKWMLETVLHRRKASVGGNFDILYASVTECLNGKARRRVRKINKTAPQQSSAPVAVSVIPASMPLNASGPSPPLPSPTTAFSQMHLFPTSPSIKTNSVVPVNAPISSHTSLPLFPTPTPITVPSQMALFKTPTRPVSLFPATAPIGIPPFPKSEPTSPKSYTDL